MNIYFVRHGKTEWNLEKRLQGQHGDSELLPESYEAIKHLAESLSDVHFDLVKSSPQKRAMTTAKLLTNQDPEADARLSEWNFGELEGQLIVDSVAKYPEEMQASREYLPHFDGSKFGAESVESVLNRFDDLADELKNSQAENILLVGHGASGTAGIRHLAGFPLAELRSAGGLANNTVSILRLEGEQFKLQKWNESL
ncbi:histidine phosphatase family protein [Lactococcus termiticola]|uniref:Phosphoglycerate mutase n=1 Tax=Lactococcus termiticola TaxID=2169526 RepID=A0A2R5HCY6_9LACT|nr:histidine phosphatase family protein [Lactococcus termiticola]GBG95937.1 phosphoglycerate mutase [Lactococcus termiticola]